MIVEYFIAALVACSTGIFTWMIAQRMQDQVDFIRGYIEKRATSRFSQLFVFVDLSKYIYIYMVSVFLVPFIITLISGELIVGLMFFGSMLLLPHFFLKMLVAKRLKQFEAQLPDAMLSLSGSLRTGASLSIAMNNLVEESQPPLSQEFTIFIRERTLGAELETAIASMEQRIPLEDLYMCFSAIQIAQDAGGNLADTLDSLAETLRTKLETEAKINSLTAQGKLQGIVMSSLPLLLIAVLMKMEPDTMRLLFHSKIGLSVFTMIVIMQVLGYISIRKITNIDV